MQHVPSSRNAAVHVEDPFENLDLERLRLRRSEKWTTHPRDVLPAFVAEMDFPLAEPVRRALTRAIELDDCGYAMAGDLGDALAGFAASRLGWAVAPDRVFLVGDVMAGVVEALQLVTAPGDGVVINTPIYPPYFSMLDTIGRRVVQVPLNRAATGWELDIAGLDAAFAAGARAYLLCSPHNPTGRVFARAELLAIADLAARHGVAVVADEIHAPLTLPGATHTPYVSLGDDLCANAVTVISASKAWNIAALKCGLVVVGSRTMRDRFAALPCDVQDRASHLGVLASLAAFREGGPWLDALLAHLDRCRDLLGELVRAHLPGVGYHAPEASYLAWLDCTALDLGDDPGQVFLRRGRVALSRGPNFGPQGAGFVRLNFGTSSALLTEAVTRMGRAL
jgi:cysteine-S-conjugate beta-lyase